jgi:hypothetical protein
MARHTAGVPWALTVTDNGRRVASVTVRTGPDGSFSVTRLVAPSSVASHWVMSARSLATGETCRIATTA